MSLAYPARQTDGSDRPVVGGGCFDLFLHLAGAEQTGRMMVYEAAEAPVPLIVLGGLKPQGIGVQWPVPPLSKSGANRPFSMFLEAIGAPVPMVLGHWALLHALDACFPWLVVVVVVLVVS